MKAERKIELAIQLVMTAFHGMVRVGPNRIPMGTHSLNVGLGLLRYGYPLETSLGGFGHDLPEDTEVTLAMIERLFNPTVRMLVAACTLNPGLPEQEAEDELFSRVTGMADAGEIRPLIIKCMDSQDNLRTNKDLKQEWQIGQFRRGMRWLGAAKKHFPNDELTKDLEIVLERERVRMGKLLD